MNKSITAIIPAAGMGKRMKNQRPKQFLLLNDEPILIITLRKLLSTALITKFIIPTIDMVYTRKIISSTFPEMNVEIIKGGKTRQESVHLGLQTIKESPLPDLILVHDSVRALVLESTIREVIDRASQTGAAIAARMVTDSIKQSGLDPSGEIVIRKNISRENLWLAQTPQVFKSEIIIEAYEKAAQEQFWGTDSSSLVERIPCTISLVESPASNIKITTPEDLKLAENYTKESSAD
jgi:2-C-methyl-D-erythritol 4-phosphate cytidylyltransferase